MEGDHSMSGGGTTIAVPSAGFSPATILARIKTVDGTGSGLDADLVRGTTPSTAGLSILALASIAVGGLLLGSGANTVGTLAIGAASTFLKSNGTTAAWTALDAGDLGTGTLAAARGGTGVSNAGTLTNASNTTITGGGTLALGGFTLTVPATGTAGLLGTAQTWSAANIFSSTVELNTSSSGLTISKTTGTTLTVSSTASAAMRSANSIYTLGGLGVEESISVGGDSADVCLYLSANLTLFRCTTTNATDLGYFDFARFTFRDPSDGYQDQLRVHNRVVTIPKVTGTTLVIGSADGASLQTDGGIAIKDGITAPSATSGYAKIYVDTSDGDLKVIFGDGTVKTIITDT
jgi:hypothetical protein